MNKTASVTVKGILADLLNAYLNSTGMALDLGQMRLYTGDAAIRALLADMKRVLSTHKNELGYEMLNGSNEVLDYRTAHKVLMDDCAALSAKNRRKVYDYIYHANLADGKRTGLDIHGAYLIDDTFKQSKSNKKNFKVIDFYTSKSNNDIQWAGVFGGYDIERSNFGKLKHSARTAFDAKNSKVNSVIIGLSGSGKTTILRRLAAECIGKTRFNVLWVYDVCTFQFSALKRHENYLIIVDDWSKVEKTPEAKQSFLNNIRELDNIRLIIGDYTLREEVEDMLYGDKVFELSPDNNKDIIKLIINKVSVWENRADDILELDEKLFKAPLFIVLFVIAKRFSDGAALDFEDFESEFKRIVKNDLTEIYSKHPVIPLLLYYTACLTKERHCITWEVFLMLAESYDKNFKPKNSLIDFSLNNPVVRALGQYISLRAIVFPGHNDARVIEFNHELLLNTLTKPLQNEWIMDDDAKLTVLDHLLKIEAYDIAYYLELRIDLSKVLKKYWGNYAEFNEIMSNAEPNLWLLCLRYDIGELYKNFRHYTDEEIEISLYNIFFYFSIPDTTKRQYRFLKGLISSLVKLGCESETINDLHEIIDDENSMSNYLWNKYGFFKRRYDWIVDNSL